VLQHAVQPAVVDVEHDTDIKLMLSMIQSWHQVDVEHDTVVTPTWCWAWRNHSMSGCLMSPALTSHVTHMYASCLPYKWVMSPTWTSHVSHTSESCLPYEWVMSPVWMSHVSRMHESCVAHERVMCPTRASHVSHMAASCSHNPKAAWHIDANTHSKFLGLFCKIAPEKWGFSAEET